MSDSKIELHLVTTDEGLAAQFRKVILAHFTGSVQLNHASASKRSVAGTLSFIDVASSETPVDLSQLDHRRCFALIAANDLPRFSEDLLACQVVVIVKPVSDQRLQLAIASAIKQNRQLTELSLSPNKRDADALLQSLLQANASLQVYDLERTAFLARAIHDLRTPLTSISGYCDLLLSKQLGDITGSQAPVLKRMQRSIGRLSHLIEGMFLLSLGSNSGRPSEWKAEAIETCIDQALHELTVFFKNRDLEIRVNVSPPERVLIFDPAQLEQVLVNLLENACKFSARGGLIKLRAYPFFWERRKERHSALDGVAERRTTIDRAANSFRIEIEDSGPGIPQDMLGHIFEEYLTVSKNDSRSGAGLGLAICKLIIVGHGGAIHAESKDTGATFSIVLPCQSLRSETYERSIPHSETSELKTQQEL